VTQQSKPLFGLNGLPRKRCPYREIKECLAQLRRCYWGGHDAFCWPSRELLFRFHNNVNELATTRRKRPFDDPWNAYLCVDRDFPRLRLVPVVGNLVSGSLEKLRAEIRVNPEQILFYRIRKAAERGGDNGRLARDLLITFRGLNACTINCKDVDWARFEPLLRDPGKNYIELAIGDKPTSTSVLCYGRVLEGLLEIKRVLELADCRPLMLWVRESAVRELPKRGRDLIPNLLAYHFLEPVDGRALEREARASRKRVRAAADSRRYRAKEQAALDGETM
jgi:hypothetical protein